MKKAKSKLEIVNPNAAGIDIGSAVYYVCVPEERDEQRVQKFSCFTEDLHNLAQWLKKCKVTTVAIKSTVDSFISNLTITHKINKLINKVLQY